jgi:reactive intermediate/imine deaminase
VNPRLPIIAILCLNGFAADFKVVTPVGGRAPVGPYSPGIIAGDFLYVSGQGAAKPDGTFHETAGEQVAQSLNNVRAIVEAGGLTMEHVVYAQLYLKDVSKYDEANRVWAKVFAKNPPARATLGVAKMPTDTPVEVTVVAVRDLSQKKVIGSGSGEPVSPAVMAGDRLYFSGVFGRDPKTGSIPQNPADQVVQAFVQIREVLELAGMDFRHVVFVNPYLTDGMPMDVMNRVYARHFEFGNTPARATIRVAALPQGASIEFTGVAVRDIAKRTAVRPKNMAPSPTASPCVFAGDTLFCSAKAGFIPGPNGGIYASTVETQVRQTMRNLLDGLEEAGMTFANVVATNVYLDDINDFAKMNKTYAEYFSKTPPTRTTVQQYPAAERKADARDRWPTLEQISLIAVK